LLDKFVDGFAEELGLEKLDEDSVEGLITYENVEIGIRLTF
jgi:hypothetical protein